jgi:hypothetical protein
MSNPLIPPLPLPDDDRLPEEGASEPGGDPATVERDGERTVDPDADESQIDSAAADRLASGADSEDDIL